jgi:hypothetical protein
VDAKRDEMDDLLAGLEEEPQDTGAETSAAA